MRWMEKRGQAERSIEAGEERVEGFVVEGDIRGQGRSMGYENRSGREGYGQSEDFVFRDL